MDTMLVSASEAARELGTNVPRLLRRARRLSLDLHKTAGKGVERYEISSAQLDSLRRDLGIIREAGEASGLSRPELQVLAALAYAPRGLLSARAVARRARVSPTTAAESIKALERRGLVVRERTMVALGRAQEVEVIRASPESVAWHSVADAVASVRLPAAHPRSARRVPLELRHLFWNTAPSQLDVEKAGGYIARRLIQTGDLDGLAWGAEQLNADDWKHAAMTRGLDPSTRALAENLAHADAGARPSRLLEEPSLVGGLRFAGLPDLIATKLKVVAQRGELRDYFDLMKLEQRGGVTVDLGISYYLARFQPDDPQTQVSAIIRSLGYFGDVDDDDLLPMPRAEVERYWQHRQPEVLRSAGWLTAGAPPPPPAELPAVSFPGGGAQRARHWVKPYTRQGKKVAGYYRD